VEGDIPGTIQLMGRTFSGDLKRERKRLEGGTSPIPELLEKVQAWQTGKQQSTIIDFKAAERKLARLMLDLARNIPEQMQLQKVSSEQPLIIEETKNPNVYLVLSGQLSIYLRGKRLHDRNNAPIVSSAGSILGEISALSEGIASATVVGNAFVLGIPIAIVQQHFASNPDFRRCMDDLASYRVL
jgi:signal-transduction protein with cAMP-binding, CBS, and nucleotidyltransferase domain